MKSLLTLTTLLLSLVANAAIVYVDVDAGSPVADGSSWAQAFDNLKEGFDAASEGDQVWVAEGLYLIEDYVSRIGNEVEIYCGFEGWETQLSQRDWENNETVFTQTFWEYNSPHIFSVVSNGTIGNPETGFIDGATFQNWGFVRPLTMILRGAQGTSYETTFRNCTFNNIFAEHDLFSFYESTTPALTLENCTFFNVNYQDEFVVESNRGQTTIIDCSFDVVNGAESLPNLSTFRNTTFFNSTIRNCTFPNLSFDETSFYGCLIESNTFTNEDIDVLTDCSVINCTIVENEFEGFFMLNDNALNCIFWNNVSLGGEDILVNSQCTVNNCIIQEEFTGNGQNNFLGDPEFVDPSSNNFRLTECSPAVDHTGTFITILASDLDGQSRVFNGVLDAGSFEYQGLGKRIIYVDFEATGNNDGTSWANAYVSLHDAIDEACPITQIWVAKGLYYPNPDTQSPNRFASFFLDSDIKIYGGFEGTESTLAQRDFNALFNNGGATRLVGTNGTGTASDDAYNVVNIASFASGIILDGLFISNGRADGFSGFGTGGGLKIQNADVTIKNCRFEGNFANFGGAISVLGDSHLDIENSQINFNVANDQGGALRITDSTNGSPVINIDRCSFSGNTADYGGGIYLYSGNVDINNTLVNQNYAYTQGSGFWVSGALNLNNCTVVDHIEAMYLAGNNIIRNCIFWNNTEDFEYAQGEASQSIKYSNLSSSTSGEGNTNTDPLFTDEIGWDFNLLLESPLINAGSNVYVVGELDRDGETRIYDDTVDMGAYERNLPCTPPNDICFDATELDIFNENSFIIDMTCANHELDNEGNCGVSGARSRWFHFNKPAFDVQFYLGDFPGQFITDNVMAFRTDCNGSSFNCGQNVTISNQSTGQDIYLKVMDWGDSDIITLNINPINPQILSVEPTQQSGCYLNSPYSLYDQQVKVTYDDMDDFSTIELNGQSFNLTSSPQYITLSGLIANGDFFDLSVNVPGSDASFNTPDFVQTPCCASGNDNCFDPYSMEYGLPASGKLDCASQSNEDILSSCTTDPGRSLWYEFEAPASGVVQIDCEITELNGPFNVRFSVWDQNDGCVDAVEVGCVNENPDNQNESGIIGGLNPGQFYLIMVSGWQDQNGSFSLTVTPEDLTSCDCPEDINNDCVMNTSDLLILLSDFGCTGSNCDADINNDGLTNSGDLVGLLAVYGDVCE